MSQELPPLETWLTLTEAADRLGIHPSTLRRWANKGEIPHMLTPGGHRRFAVSDIKRFAEERSRLRRVPALEKIWAEQAMTQARQEIVTHQDQRWLSAFDDDMRQRHRLLGRRLMGLTLQYISDQEGNGSILEEARAVGLEYGRLSQKTGLPLTEALQAAMFFRDMLVEVAIQLPETARIRPEANTRLMRRINALLNTVSLAIAEVYDNV